MLFSLCGGLLPVVADNEWSGNEKIKVEGKAKSAGTISFKISFQPAEDGTAVDTVKIDVLVSDKTKKDDVAVFITNNFRAVLGDDNFKINQSWGNNVSVKAKGDTPDFSVEMTGNSVQGISLEIDD